ncbi:MAG: hypothetical protein ACJ76L_13555 [Conexibacter sp.]
MNDRRPPMRARLVPPLLAVAGWWAVLVAVGGDAWPLLLGWLVGIAAIAFAATATRERTRMLAALALAVVCVALTWEGGHFFMPGAGALAVVPWRPDGPARGV